MKTISPLHKKRLQYKPTLPSVLTTGAPSVTFGKATGAVKNTAELKKIFVHTFGQPIAGVGTVSKNPQGKNKLSAHRVGVILSGGPAAGGHNVIAGLFDALTKANTSSRLIGFLGGPSGLTDNKKIVINKTLIDEYRNTGGFDIIGSGRTKIETPAQFASALTTARANKLTAVVVIGGDDSNTNAALLAEYFTANRKPKEQPIQVIGVPKTIDGDLKTEHIEISFGFDTAVKTYSELIGNIARDSASAKKYWHFIRLMGRSASHITLECALQTQPSITLISEEVQKKKQSLRDIVNYIADGVCARAKKGQNFGVVLVPEGLIEFIPEMGLLISELNDIMAQKKSVTGNIQKKIQAVETALPPALKKTFALLPSTIQEQLLLDRDAHGNVQVSLIETERLLLEMVKTELVQREKSCDAKKKFTGSFAAQNHFFGYEARCAFPSNFDASYCYALGYNAFILIANGLTGYMSSVRNLTAPATQWKAGGIPLTMMMNIERRHGHNKPVIRKALVELSGAPFKTFAASRASWLTTTSFRYPGAIQYDGDADIANAPTITLQLEKRTPVKLKPAVKQSSKNKQKK